VPSVPDELFHLAFQFGEDGCFDKGLAGKDAQRDVDIVSPASFGYDGRMSPVSECLHSFWLRL
jgi:hypothetical protein